MSKRISDEELGRILRRACAQPIGVLPPWTMTLAEMREEADRCLREEADRRWSRRLLNWLRSRAIDRSEQ